MKSSRQLVIAFVACVAAACGEKSAVDSSGGTGGSAGAAGSARMTGSGTGGASGSSGGQGGSNSSGGGANASGGGGQAGEGTGGSGGATGGSSGGEPSGADASATSGGSGGGGSGGHAGNAAEGGTAGGADGGGSAGAGGGSAAHPLNVTAAKARYNHTFRTKDADPTVTFNDNTQEAAVDNRAKTMIGKLVLPFQGQGKTNGAIGPAGEFAARRGFHVLGIAAYQDYTITVDDADFYGDARKEVFDGIVHTKKNEFATIAMTPAGGVAQRTQKALAYLQSKYPTEDWGYYLNPDGTVRWTDVIIVGMSHGASNAARWGMLVEASRVISLSGPRDNMCTSLNSANCGGVVAKWFYEKPATPIDRFYAITGEKDDQHLQHLFAMQEMKYVGANINVEGKKAPFNDSHRLSTSVGHTDMCDESKYFDVCNYVFGVPVENQTPTQ